MGFLKNVAKFASPILGAGAGFLVGGPVGAAIGGTLGGGISGAIAASDAQKAQDKINAQNIALQREFAQHGVRWKVEDAKAAGIHPLAALGASTHSFSANLSPGPVADVSGMGQDITRALASTMTQPEKAAATLQLKSMELDVQGKEIDNQIKAAQLQKLNNPTPPFPASDHFIPGQGNSGPAGLNLIDAKALERTVTNAGIPDQEPGALPGVGWESTKTGVVPIPSKDVKERIEDNIFHELRHFYRNNILPNFGEGPKPPKSALPKGATDWEWSHWHQEYRPYFPKYKFERR